MRSDDTIQGDGRKAYLPHPVFQNCLFSASRERQLNECRKRQVSVQRQNRWGDILTIRSAQTLFARPDMGVFLSTVALVQKAGFERLVGEDTGDPSPRLASRFPIRDLYDLTHMGRSKARETLLTSMEVLGSVSLSVRYANPAKHQGNQSLSLASFWDLKIERRKGRGGSMVNIYPADFLIPRKQYLFADAELCCSLRSDTARGIFWALLCREHMAWTAQEWRAMLSPESRDPRVDRWKSRYFLPALEEISGYGYDVRDDGDVVTVSRPKRRKGLPGRE